MEPFDVGMIVFVVLFMIFLGWAIINMDVEHQTDCQEICTMNGSEMRRVTSFGCLCEDGHVYSHTRH